MEAERGKFRKNVLTCNKKQTCHVGHEACDVLYAASPPQGGGGLGFGGGGTLDFKC